jgi:hypothetical protein
MVNGECRVFIVPEKCAMGGRGFKAEEVKRKQPRVIPTTT